MFVHNNIRAVVLASAVGLLTLSAARADEIVLVSTAFQLQAATSLSHVPTEPKAEVAEPAAEEPASLLQRTSTSLQSTLNDALDLIGIRYRRGGTSPESGFDCSGFVSHVFREGLGLYLPHSAKAMSQTGSPVARNELKPGDLVFFRTVRRTISHVGIYLGDNLFVHAPHTGGRVRIENLGETYWAKHFSGARRLAVE